MDLEKAIAASAAVGVRRTDKGLEKFESKRFKKNHHKDTKDTKNAEKKTEQ